MWSACWPTVAWRRREAGVASSAASIQAHRHRIERATLLEVGGQEALDVRKRHAVAQAWNHIERMLGPWQLQVYGRRTEGFQPGIQLATKPRLDDMVASAIDEQRRGTCADAYVTGDAAAYSCGTSSGVPPRKASSTGRTGSGSGHGGVRQPSAKSVGP